MMARAISCAHGNPWHVLTQGSSHFSVNSWLITLMYVSTMRSMHLSETLQNSGEKISLTHEGVEAPSQSLGRLVAARFIDALILSSCCMREWWILMITLLKPPLLEPMISFTRLCMPSTLQKQRRTMKTEVRSNSTIVAILKSTNRTVEVCKHLFDVIV